MLTYCIGDIHGCKKLLDQAIKWILNDWKTGQSGQIIFIGDYVDRGPDSKAVIDTLIQLRVRSKLKMGSESRIICLKGKHDYYFADAVLRNRNKDWSTYMTFGCLPTLASYGIYPRPTEDNQLFIDLPIINHEAIVHAKWIDTLPYMYEDDDRYYVHAGFQPGVPIEHQSKYTMMWICEEFLNSNHDFGKMVIHGHTPYLEKNIQIKSNRINIDTGAVFGGHLTVARFEDDQEPHFQQFQETKELIKG